MSITPTKFRQLLFFAAAIVLLACGFGMQGTLNDVQEAYELVLPDNVVQENHPELVLFETMPGGLRAIAVNYLWIRTEELKQDGKYHESRQLAEMICKLMPRQAGVWGYHAWNNAFNISVGTHTEDERWEWVTSGVRLLRDEGIPRNPRALDLYKELGWIFWMKMGGQLDDMHKTYKSRWAGEMQYLLGAPPLGETSVVLEAFTPITQATLIRPEQDKLIQPGSSLVQAGPLKALLADPQVAAMLTALSDAGIDKLVTNTGRTEEDWKAELAMRSPNVRPLSFFSAYYRFSLDDAIQSVRLQRPAPRTERDAKIFTVINDPAHADARTKTLAFLRAQILWNAYKLDPNWMLEMMELYGPLDWRSVQAHALYWMTYGLHVCTELSLDKIATEVAASEEYRTRKDEERTGLVKINADRVLFNSLKDLTWYGRVTLLEDQQWVPSASGEPGTEVLEPGPIRPESPVVLYMADARFIEPLNKLTDRTIREVIAIENRPYERNLFKAGHMNYLVSAMRLLYMLDRPRQAQALFDEMKENYKLAGDKDWDKDLDTLLTERLIQDGGRPITSEGTAQITAGLVTSLTLMAITDDKASQERAAYFLNWARTVHAATNADTTDRIRLARFDFFTQVVARNLLISPEVYGLSIDLQDRAKLWRSMPEVWRCFIYGSLIVPLGFQCEQQGIPFDTTFPEPPGMREFQRYMEQEQDRVRVPPPPPG